jgi:hypothetical protein
MIVNKEKKRNGRDEAFEEKRVRRKIGCFGRIFCFSAQVGNTLLANQLLKDLQNDISGYFLVGNRLFAHLGIL